MRHYAHFCRKQGVLNVGDVSGFQSPPLMLENSVWNVALYSVSLN